MLPLRSRSTLRLSVCHVCRACRVARLQRGNDVDLDNSAAAAAASSWPGRVRGARASAAEAAIAAARLIPRDRASNVGGAQNNLTRVESLSLAEIAAGPDALDAASSGGGGGGGGEDADTLDDGPSRTVDADDDAAPASALERPYGALAPRAGDLLEISTDSWRVQLLAVCLGSFGGADHFYTNTGQWFASTGVRSLFGVTGFATAAELAPVVAALPAAVREAGPAVPGLDGDGDDADAFGTALNTLQDLGMGPTREAGAGLLRKMHAFAEQAAAIHIAHAAVLDNAFKVLRAVAMKDAGAGAGAAAAGPTATLPYMTLDQLAALLLRREGHKILGTRRHYAYAAKHSQCPPLRHEPGTATGTGGDEFTAPAMYAVYRAVMTDELAFRPLATHAGSAVEEGEEEEGGQKSRTRSCFFVVADPDDVDIVHDVEAAVRHFCDEYAFVRGNSRSGHLPVVVLKRASSLGAFLAKARVTIDRSRKIRPWLPCGTVGPAGKDRATALYPPRVELWSHADLRFLRFLHLWAGAQRFAPASRLHWVGAAILRASERYRDVEYLTPATGWTFLQEVGYVAPWDLPARHSMALPDVPPDRTGGLVQPTAAPPSLSSRQPFRGPGAGAGFGAGSGSGSGSGADAGTDDNNNNNHPLLADDLFADCRHDWGAPAAGAPAGSPPPTVFAIDGADAADIDDAVSVEPAPGHPGDVWVHVHVADPASCIRPGSPLARQAARLPQSAYLPGHEARMFADDVVRARFSLGPGQPCLTFSARVHCASGHVRATAIRPGRLGRRVVFMTPAEAARAVAAAEAAAAAALRLDPVPDGPAALRAAGQLPSATAVFAVGTPPPKKQQTEDPAARRPMTSADDLAPDQRADLETLATVATALRAVRLANGAMPFYWPRPAVSVDVSGTSVVAVDAGRRPDKKADAPSPSPTTTTHSPRAAFYETAYTVQSAGDPYIRISYGDGDGDGDPDTNPDAAAPGRRLVESLMRLAGEVAADWSHARGLPVPFRGQPDARLHDPAAIRALARDHVYGPLAAGRRPRDAALRALRRLVGPDDLAAVAVPYVTMGVPRYVKATSPLRRYGDLVAHWQIEGKLLEEAAGAGAGGGGKPPFSRPQMERDVLPLLRARERALRALDNQAGRDQWMLQALVRAWTAAAAAAEPATPLPDAFRFAVTRVDSRRGAVVGRLDWFERAAVMELADLNPTAPVGSGAGSGAGSDESAAAGPDLAFVRLDHVQPGQVYPVVLQHVDVHGNRVLVRRIGAALQ